MTDENGAGGADGADGADGGTMRGVLRVASREVRVADVPRPRLEPGTAVVRVRASGICGSDLHVYRSLDRPETRPSGHEVAGEVVAIAPHAGEPS